MARYSVLMVTTSSVPGSGGSLDFELDLPASNNVDVYKIKIVPSGGTGTSEFSIFKASARLPSDLVYKTQPWDSAIWFDPVEDDSSVLSERAEGFVCRYEDSDFAKKMYLTIVNNDASPRTYDIEVSIDESPYNPSTIGVPDILAAQATANGLFVATGVGATVNNSSIDKAEFRALCIPLGQPLPLTEDLRTAAEGGSFVHNGTTQLYVQNIPASPLGATYRWTSTQDGRWYYAWRLHNNSGWSNWTDGNEDPSAVAQWVDTNSNTDTAPPSNWQVTIERGPRENTIVVHATRPRTQGDTITGFACQIKDASVGSWRALDANAGAAETRYNGSGTNHTFDLATGLFARVSGTGFGTAAVGDIILYDVRGNGLFDITHCRGDVVKTVGSTTIETYTPQSGFLSTASETGGVLDQVRFKIVKPMWTWDSEGYMGGWQPNGGYWDWGFSQFQRYMWPDHTTQEFISDPIPIDPGASSVEARVWFTNGYSTSDGNIIHSTEIVGGTGILNGYTWLSFTDRSWWVPTNSDKDNLEIVFDASGRPVITNKTSAYPAYGFAGVIGRFRVTPNASGIIQIRVQFTCTQLTGGSATSWKNAVGMWLETFGMVPPSVIGTAVSDDYAGFVASHHWRSGGSPSGDFLTLQHVNGLSHQDGVSGVQSSLGSTTGPGTGKYHRADIALPSRPFDVELRLTIEEDLAMADPVRAKIVWKTYEYRIDGGGWNTIPSIGVDPYIYERHWPLNWKGFSPVLGCMPMTSKAGDNVTLKQFSVIQGLCVRS